ncbi:Na(+)/H(+) antiporter subunit C [Nonomuraea phyllanthi]|uniref:Na(+)/H(+) antiporter subunit C n=1 Tax=Nonomuraea phyllanthi TaxID=2219224 RepID=A0A5C4VRJ0_9ACTN|nr:Na(+)/H(+) antiporter subunit C [Nonomuraea phyllanthi]KAB8189801.1 Na(+)/H(+) antiporter subunit C [Nonomuraea phyllanthi]QFY08756.1 Na(+)/H(+) antiporter subunit C [Nonomuraea phyllanthi]
MTVTLLPYAACFAMVATGVTLLLERSLVRALTGVITLGNGVNLLIITAGGDPGGPPYVGTPGIADPLPQAMVLTAIVITLGVTAYLLALVHRSWQLSGSDEVQDDTEDRRVRLRARRGELSDAVRARQDDYRRLLAEQRAELARMEAEQAERQRLREVDLERRIFRVHTELEQWMREGRRQGLSEEELLRRLEDAGLREDVAPAEGVPVDNLRRLEELREQYERGREEQAARERALRRRLKARQREARKEMRAAIREERERQALARDPELEGED